MKHRQAYPKSVHGLATLFLFVGAAMAGQALAPSSSAAVQVSVAAAEEGEEEEGAGNNLSFPAFLAEGIGMSGGDVADGPENTGFRGLPGEEKFEGEFRYWWPEADEESGASCDPVELGCPPVPAPPGLEEVFVQQDEDNEWQATWVDGRTEEMPLAVDEIDWGDNLENQVWRTNSVVRAEVVLYKDAALDGYEMRYLSGQGPDESWGTNGNIIEHDQATVFSPCAGFTIQKLQRGTGSLDAPPPTQSLRWNAADREWGWTGTGAIATVFNHAIWEALGAEGPTDRYTAEVNIAGKLIYGTLWDIRRSELPAGFEKSGWYRLTFSLDGTQDGATPAQPCGDFELNTSVRDAGITVAEEEEGDDEEGPPEDPATAAAEEPGEDDGDADRPSFTPVVDADKNLTYLDVFVEERQSGSRPVAVGQRGKGRPSVSVRRR